MADQVDPASWSHGCERSQAKPRYSTRFAAPRQDDGLTEEEAEVEGRAADERRGMPSVEAGRGELWLSEVRASAAGPRGWSARAGAACVAGCAPPGREGRLELVARTLDGRAGKRGLAERRVGGSPGLFDPLSPSSIRRQRARHWVECRPCPIRRPHQVVAARMALRRGRRAVRGRSHAGS